MRNSNNTANGTNGPSDQNPNTTERNRAARMAQFDDLSRLEWYLPSLARLDKAKGRPTAPL